MALGIRAVEDGVLDRRDFLIWATAASLTSLPVRQSLLGALFGIGDSAIRKARDRVDGILEQRLALLGEPSHRQAGWVSRSAAEVFADLHAEVLSWPNNPQVDAAAVDRLRQLVLGHPPCRRPAAASTAQRTAESRRTTALTAQLRERLAVAAAGVSVSEVLADPPPPLLLPYLSVAPEGLSSLDLERRFADAQEAHDRGGGAFLSSMADTIMGLANARGMNPALEARAYLLLTAYLMGFEHIAAVRTGRHVRAILQNHRRIHGLPPAERLGMMITALVHPAIVLRAHGYIGPAKRHLRAARAHLERHGSVLPPEQLADLRIDTALHLTANALIDPGEPRLDARLGEARGEWTLAAGLLDRYRLPHRHVLLHRRRLELETAAQAGRRHPTRRAQRNLSSVADSFALPAVPSPAPWMLTWLLAQAGAAVARRDIGDFVRWGETFVDLLRRFPMYDNQRRSWMAILADAEQRWPEDFSAITLEDGSLVVGHPLSAPPLLVVGIPQQHRWSPTVPSLRRYLFK